MSVHTEHILNFIKQDEFCQNKINIHIFNGEEPDYIKDLDYAAMVFPERWDYKNSDWFRIMVRKSFYHDEQQMIGAIIHEIGHCVAATKFNQKFRDERQAWLCGLKYVPTELIPNSYLWQAENGLLAYKYPKKTARDFKFKLRRYFRNYKGILKNDIK